MDLYSARPDALAYETIGDMCEVLPMFRVRRMCISLEFSIPLTYCIVDSARGVTKMVLCSDSKRFSEELAAAGKRSKRDVIKRYKSLVRERVKAGGYSVPSSSVDSSIYSLPMLCQSWRRLQNSQRRTREQTLKSEELNGAGSIIHPQVNPLIPFRIWEKLSEDGWGKEIATRKSMYEKGLKEIKGVVMARPLGEKGVHIPNSCFVMT